MGITVRPAKEEHVASIAALVNAFAGQNLMLPRTEVSILQSLPDWLVAVEGSAPGQESSPQADAALEHAEERGGGPTLLGCGSLVPLTEQLVEIRSLAVASQGQGKGIGRRIVQDLVQMATAHGYAQICALTLQEAFFEKLGFAVVDRWSISPKLWQDCIYCPKFHHCDEVAVARNLTDRPPTEPHAIQTAAAPLLKWQAWQPLKLAYRRSGNKAVAQPATARKPIRLDQTSSHEEDVA